MKNKVNTSLLLIAALGIWGTIIYKIIDGLSTDEEKKVEFVENVTFNMPTPKKVDSFSLLPIDRDPFLDKPLVKDKAPKKPIQRQTSVEITIPLVYHGMIKKNNGKQQLFIVSINGQQTFMKKGQENQGIKLLSGNEKNITVSYKGTRKTIEKG